MSAKDEAELMTGGMRVACIWLHGEPLERCIDSYYCCGRWVDVHFADIGVEPLYELETIA